MSDALPVVYLARHGQTAWTISRQHTGLTDLPLTAQGEVEARQLGERLEGLTFAGVLTSPLQRAVRTCELAGFGSAARVEPDLLEWNYGSYEGLTSVEIRNERPDWQLFRDGCPGGEVPDQVGARADRVARRVLARARTGGGQVLSAGHSQPQRCGVRARPVRAGDPPLERDSLPRSHHPGADAGTPGEGTAMSANESTTPRAATTPDALATLRRQYSCGPVELTGSANALNK